MTDWSLSAWLRPELGIIILLILFIWKSRNIDGGLVRKYAPKQGHHNVIHPSFIHGENFQIGHFNHIHENVKVGDNVTILNYVELRPGTNVGDRVYIDSGVKTSGDCTIDDDAVLRYNVIIAREVTVEEGVFLAPNVMTNYLNAKGEKVGGTVIGAGSFIGTGAVIDAGIKICPGAIVGELALVKHDITEPGVYVGIPARKQN